MQSEFEMHFSDIKVTQIENAKQSEFNKYQVLLLKVLARYFDPMFPGLFKKFESSPWVPRVARTKM